jgi:hypothetical protein
MHIPLQVHTLVFKQVLRTLKAAAQGSEVQQPAVALAPVFEYREGATVDRIFFSPTIHLPIARETRGYWHIEALSSPKLTNSLHLGHMSTPSSGGSWHP